MGVQHGSAPYGFRARPLEAPQRDEESGRKNAIRQSEVV